MEINLITPTPTPKTSYEIAIAEAPLLRQIQWETLTVDEARNYAFILSFFFFFQLYLSFRCLFLF